MAEKEKRSPSGRVPPDGKPQRDIKVQLPDRHIKKMRAWDYYS